MKIEDGSWPEEAYTLVADITKGTIMYTQVADYTEDGVPLVLCYVVVGPQVRISFVLFNLMVNCVYWFSFFFCSK